MDILINKVKKLLNLIDLLDNETRQHSLNVAYYTSILAGRLGVTESDITKYYYYGLFHDIGKLNVSLDILRKSSRLNDIEYSEIQKHTLYGEQLVIENYLEDDDFKLVLLDIVRHHHERVDGSGYPDRLSSDEILLPVRIVSVADAFDAMLSHRCYKSSLGINDALKELKCQSNKQFDSLVVDLVFRGFKVEEL